MSNLAAFVILAAAMTLAALGIVLWPLLRKVRAWPAATLAGLAIPAIAVTLYFTLSNWAWDPARAPEGVPPEIERMVSGLETRLRANPTDVNGWLMLGRSYFHLSRYFKAADAYQQAYTLTQARNIDAVVGLAEALAFADENMLLGRSAELFDQAYKLAPDNPKVLWYTGLVGYQSGRMALARERWAQLVAMEPPPEVKQILQQKIAEIEQTLTVGPAPGTSPALAASAADAQAQGASSQGASNEAQAASVKVRVALSPDLAGRAPPDAALFVLVRSGQGGGPPLAVTRRVASQLPLLVELTDRDAMISGRGLTGAGPVTVVARIARSGGPTARSGDLEGTVSYDLARATPVDLIIDSIVP